MSNLPTIGKEEEYGKNIDKCITDLAIKVGEFVLNELLFFDNYYPFFPI